jgi:hypothetical protein
MERRGPEGGLGRGGRVPGGGAAYEGRTWGKNTGCHTQRGRGRRGRAGAIVSSGPRGGLLQGGEQRLNLVRVRVRARARVRVLGLGLGLGLGLVGLGLGLGLGF